MFTLRSRLRLDAVLLDQDRGYKSKKRLPLETKNTQSHENRRLGLIESLHMQHCSLRDCIRPPSASLSGVRFQNNQNGPNDPKRNKI